MTQLIFSSCSLLFAAIACRIVSELRRYSPKLLRVFILVALTALLSACNDKTLYAKLSEREANEMVALLLSSGMSANKADDKNDLFRITTTSSDFAPAVKLLGLNGFPRRTYDSISELLSKDSIVSSKLEERARLNFALSQEIAYTLSNVDGVLLARVHLAVPAQDAFNNEPPVASASVFIKHRSDVDLSGQTSTIKNLVVNGIENLSYENVTVAFFKAGYSTQALTEPVAQNSGVLTGQSLQASSFDQLRMNILPTSILSAISPMFLVLLALGLGLLFVGSKLWLGRSVARDTIKGDVTVNGIDKP